MRAEREPSPAVEVPESEHKPSLVVSPLAQLVERASALAAQGRASEAFGLIETELAREGGHAPVGARAALLIEASIILWLLGRYDESFARARRGLVLAELSGDPRLAADALLRQGLALHRQGRLEPAREAYEEAGARFRRLKDAQHSAAVSNNLGLVCKDRGDWNGARAHFEDAIAAARRDPRPGVLGTRLQNLGVLELKSGLWARARATLEEARASLGEVDDRRGAIANALARGNLARLEGHAEAAHALAREALSAALAEHLPREEALACELAGDIALDARDFSATRRHYERALKLGQRTAPESSLACELLRRMAMLALAQGDHGAAGRWIAQAAAAADQLGDAYESALIQRAEGDRLHELGQGEEAQAQWLEAASALEEIGERYERGLTLARLARTATTPDETFRFAFRASSSLAEAGAERELRELEALVTRRLAGASGTPAPAPREIPAATPGRAAASVRDELVGASRAIARLRVRVSRAARKEHPVLLRGEAGVGKDLIARLLHERGPRRAAPLIVVRCAEIPPERLLGHLFGDVRPELRARDRIDPGWFERAHGGTLYLDQAAELPLPVQSALVRHLQRGIFFRLGDLEPRTADVRLIVSLRQGFDGSAPPKALRADLLARFALGTIDIPTLRERREDILPLARRTLESRPESPAPRLSAEAAALLIEHPWFGNVQELEDCMREVLSDLSPETLIVPPEVVARILNLTGEAGEAADPGGTRAAGDGRAEPASGGEEGTLLRARLRELERQRILRSLARARGNKTRAAAELRIARKTLYERMRKLGIALA